MFAFALVGLAGVSTAQMMSSNGYSRGVPPTTQNCNSYPLLAAGGGNFDRQDLPWGLVVDREFGGCRCADEQETEFTPNPADYKDNTWACRCLNHDLYPSKPQGKYTCTLNGAVQDAVAATRVVPAHTTDVATGCGAVNVARLNDLNGKKCGVIQPC